jgi:hypothetical protein
MKIIIQEKNDAFVQNPREISRILREIAFKMDKGQRPTVARDINGNKVGVIVYEDKR